MLNTTNRYCTVSLWLLKTFFSNTITCVLVDWSAKEMKLLNSTSLCKGWRFISNSPNRSQNDYQVMFTSKGLYPQFLQDRITWCSKSHYYIYTSLPEEKVSLDFNKWKVNVYFGIFGLLLRIFSHNSCLNIWLVECVLLS